MSYAARSLLFALTTFLLAAGALAEPARGIDYRELPSVQPSANGEVEVIEFFWYRCPHCYEFEARLKRWTAKLPADVRLKRVPVVFNAEWAIDARIFYALEAMGEEGRLRDALYDAIHLKGGRGLDRRRYERWAEEWLSQHGVEMTRFKAAAQSEGVREQVEQARRMTIAYGIEGTPTLAIQGRYVVDANAGSQPQMLAVTSYLVNRVRKVREAEWTDGAPRINMAASPRER